jgi:FkbM family methyltransferase
VGLINYIRNKYHPLWFLYKFKFIRILVSKIKITYYKKTNRFGNFYIYLPRHLGYLLNNESIEKETYDFVTKLNLKKNIVNKTFVDIGGNIGTYSLFFKENYNAKVFVFEPDDDNLSLLLRSKIKNKLKDFNIISLAISNEDKIESFLIDHIGGATGSISSVKNVGQIRQELYLKKDIITLKLDNFYNIIENISWIKIDTEGNEVNVIKGMIKIIKLNKPNLIIECEDTNIDQIKELLKEVKYNIKKMNTDMNYIFYL